MSFLRLGSLDAGDRLDLLLVVMWRPAHVLIPMQYGNHQRRGRPAREPQFFFDNNLSPQRYRKEYAKESNAQRPEYQLRHADVEWATFRRLEESLESRDYADEAGRKGHRADSYGDGLYKHYGKAYELLFVPKCAGHGNIPFSTGVKGRLRCFANDLKIAKPIRDEGIDIIETHPALFISSQHFSDSYLFATPPPVCACSHVTVGFSRSEARWVTDSEAQNTCLRNSR